MHRDSNISFPVFLCSALLQEECMFWISLLLPLAVITMILQMRRVLRKRAGQAFHPDDVQHNLTLRELTVREKLESHGWL
jgi:hypothetical protein